VVFVTGNASRFCVGLVAGDGNDRLSRLPLTAFAWVTAAYGNYSVQTQVSKIQMSVVE